jgi:hypothetical protein
LRGLEKDVEVIMRDAAPHSYRQLPGAEAIRVTPSVDRPYDAVFVIECSDIDRPGFWETSHYEPGTAAPARIDAFGLPIGVQICSDANRPEGSHLLGAQGAQAILIF